MVHVSRGQVLVDALASLPWDRRERVERSETKLVGYLDEWLGSEEAPPAP
ncbi:MULTISPECIES: hypothetical protein [Streptomyces]|nr:hypothetical protein [Streptomyces sp. NRRL S-4]